MHERFATFLAGEFKSQLLIQNLRQDASITVTPSLILDEGEVLLAPVVLGPHSSQVVDITAALQTSGKKDTRGAVALRYEFNNYGAITTEVESVDEAHWLYLTSVGRSKEEFWDGTTIDAVVWAPDPDTRGFVSITNASTESRTVHPAFVVDGRLENQSAITVAPRQTRFLPVDGLIARSTKNGAGIRLAFDGYPGDVVAEGQLYKK